MKCFYHSADLDGHCSGAIVKRKYPGCEMIGINYGDEFPWESIAPGEKVFMVDFGLQPFSDMERLQKVSELIWIDHHKSALADAAKAGFVAGGVVKDGRAGCELTWEFLFPEQPIPWAVHLLGRYDVWDHSDEHTLPFQYGMRNAADTLPENQDFWGKVFCGGDFFTKTLNEGSLIIRYEKVQNEKFCKTYAFETEFDGIKGICVNRGLTNSKVFDSVYDPERHRLMITFCRLKPPAGKWTVSLYSTREDVDCGALAKSFGGGGHKGAAGFQCEDLPFKI
jgi:oligoribonuclease NrnB/cAMP/cGMP phosphodiesterase (DHH superfamily)